jgi:hypothetical protein
MKISLIIHYRVDSESSVVMKSLSFDVDKTYDHIPHLCLILDSRDGYNFLYQIHYIISTI